MPKCIMPPASGPASRISTLWPSRVSCQAADRPLGPAPTTRILRPLGAPCFELPALLVGAVAEKTFHRVDADRLIEHAAVAAVFAGVVADPAVYRRQRIVGDQRLPGLPEIAGLGVRQPGLDVLAGRAGMIAGRQHVHIHGTLHALLLTDPLFVGQVQRAGHITGFSTHALCTITSGPTQIGDTAATGYRRHYQPFPSLPI